MIDLYKTLGVKQNATVKAIRSAYRSKAKKAHPDMPDGDAAEFAKLKLAHDILTDPVRRLRYENTGDTSDGSSVNNEMVPIIAELANTLENVLTQIENRQGNPTEYELINDMKTLLGGKIDSVKTRIKQLERLKEKTEKLLGRFGVKEGENYLEKIIIGKISAIDTNLRMTNAQLEPLEKALEILRNSSFKSDGGGQKYGHRYGSAFNMEALMNQTFGGF